MYILSNFFVVIYLLQEEKKSFKEKLQQIQEVCLQVQEGMDMVASGGERVKKWVLNTSAVPL